MRFLIFDAETFFDFKVYTLKKQTTEEYVRDPRFELHGAAVKWMGGGPAVWLDESNLRAFFGTVDWSDTAIVCHHAQFDLLILSHHYGIQPKLRVCTLSMARLMIGNHLSVSLDSVRAYFGLPVKHTPYNLFAGKHWREMDPYTQHRVAAGAADEVESIEKIFGYLMKMGFPPTEFEVIDITMRMFTDPVLIGDLDELNKVWLAENNAKQQRLDDLGIERAELMSGDKFAQLLRDYGVEPEMKLNAKGKEIYAFAKTDEFMRQLQESDDEYIVALAEARLGAKSTLVQSRAERVGFMAARGLLCIYLSYAAAHTTRWGGGDGTNFQNFPARNKSALGLRRSIKSPDGWTLIKPDKAQIECRILNTFAGQGDKVAEFREGKDPYIGVASAFYGRQITKENDPLERQCGKVLELQCGYGSGGAKIRATLKNQETPIIISEEEGVHARDAYRDTHPAVVELWKAGTWALRMIANGAQVEWGPLQISKGRVALADGPPMIYHLDWHHNLETGEKYWRRKTRNGYVKIYGAKLVENVVQYMARVIISDDMVALARMGYRIVNTEHDSLWILLPINSSNSDSGIDSHKKIISEVMSRTPWWMPHLPVGVEIN